MILMIVMWKRLILRVRTCQLGFRRSVFGSDKVSDSPPQFSMRLRDRRIQMTYPVRLTCQVVGHPIPSVKWYKDGQEIYEDVRHTFWPEDNFHTLEITKTMLEDTGSYCITAQNRYGSVSCRCNLIVDQGIPAYIAPLFKTHLEPKICEVIEGRELKLTGTIDAYPTVGVVWCKDGIRLRASRKTIMTLSYDGRIELSVASVTKKDGGMYTCIATNEVGRVESIATVVIKEKATVTSKIPDVDQTIEEPQLKRDIPFSKEPKFLKKPRSTDAFEGDNIVILCEVIGDPKPEVLWLRDFLRPDYYRDAPHFHLVGDGPEYRLEIPNAKLDFTGTYTIYAKNCHGDTKAIISLQIKVRDNGVENSTMDRRRIGTVQTMPKIVSTLKDLRCCDGDSATFECRVEATPAPDIRWEKDGKLIRLGGDFQSDFDGKIARLSIKQVYPEDEGEYTCVVYNDLGKDFTSACLLVDVPEGKENLLTQQLRRPSRELCLPFTKSSPRVTPTRSMSPTPRYREMPSTDVVRRVRSSAPKFYAVPHNKVAEEGETVRFQCAVAGHPDPWTTWKKDGMDLMPSGRIRITENDDLRVLEIRSVQPDDSGVYKVTLENSAGRIEASAKLDVVAHRTYTSRSIRARSLSPRSAPCYHRELVGGSARYGSTARLFADIRSVPTAFLKWYKDGIPLEESSKYTMSYDGKIVCLDIFNITELDAGFYSCEATNSKGTAISAAKLEVTGSSDAMPPAIVEGLPVTLGTTEGYPIRLLLRANGTGALDIIWMKDGCVLPDCDDFRQIDHGDGRFELFLRDPHVQDSGDYRCEIYNMFGDTMTKCHVDVHELPMASPALEFSKQPNPVIATEGSNASFCVRVRKLVDEKVKVRWEIAGRTVLPSSKYRVEEDGDVSILHITNVTRLDAGQVKCTATQRVQSTSNVGQEPTSVTVSCSAHLTVLSSPDDLCLERSDSEKFDVMSDDDPQVLSGEVPRKGEPAMVLKGPQDMTALVGDRVLLKATYMGHPEPTVKWNKAGRDLKNDERTSITSGKGLSCLLLQDIIADDSGKYEINIENSHGADCQFASVAVEGPPDPPSGQPCVKANLGSATITWSSSPYDGGKKVTGFAVEYSLAGSDVWSTVIEECQSLSYTMSGLQPGAQYVFRVRAQNVHGYSRPSAESDVLQLEESGEHSSFEPRMVTVEPGPEFKERYEILEELGKGRFGIVHKVIDKANNQKLAAKFIKCRSAKDHDKVQEEIDIMNLLRHQKLLQLAAAFEHPREVIMVTEYITGGELFERVVADDFTLTEKDCILFMRQICEGVAYMHSQMIVHLDLKPENIMCHTRTSHEIKIIDFGLAQKLNPDQPVRVLFGTPEFVPPEVINYEPIGVESDMWSLGVICYVLLSGLSPFMGDNDAETFANITRADFDFDDDAFNAVSQHARDFIAELLVKRKEERLSAEQCLKHIWLDPNSHQETVVLCTDKLKKFIIRRKWQKTGNALRALGRMATLSASRRNSGNNSAPTTPRPSISGSTVQRMSSLNEEDLTVNKDISHIEAQDSSDDRVNEDDNINTSHNTNSLKQPETKSSDDVDHVLSKSQVNAGPVEEILTHQDITISKSVQSRSCTERSDSGISDCSTHLTSASCSCNSTPLLGKKFLINEESEKSILESRTTVLHNYNNGYEFNYTNHSARKDSVISTTLSSSTSRSNTDDLSELLKVDQAMKTKNGSKLLTKIDTYTTNLQVKSKPPSASGSLKRLPIYSSRSVANAIKKFDSKDLSEVIATETPKSKESNSEPSESNPQYINQNKELVKSESNGISIDKDKETTANKKFEKTKKKESTISSNKEDTLSTKEVSIADSSCEIRLENKSNTRCKETQNVTIYEKKNLETNGVISCKKPLTEQKSEPTSKIETIINRYASRVEKSNLTTPSIRYRSPSPSLLRKTKAFMAKEQNNDLLTSKHSKSKDNTNIVPNKNAINSKMNSCPKSPFAAKKTKPKSESFQKAAAFWNSPKT